MIGDLLRVSLRHDLHVHRPFWEVASLNRIIEIALVAFTVVTDERAGIGVRKILDALLSTEMKLHPKSLALRIPKAIGMRAKTMHVAIASRDTSVAHHNGHLM